MPWGKEWLSTAALLPVKSSGLRSLAGYSPWGRRVEHDWQTVVQSDSLRPYGLQHARLPCHSPSPGVH